MSWGDAQEGSIQDLNLLGSKAPSQGLSASSPAPCPWGTQVTHDIHVTQHILIHRCTRILIKPQNACTDEKEEEETVPQMNYFSSCLAWH